MVASAYKASLDADSSIAANTVGSFYVYPNNPAGMSVLVDPAFNNPQVGSGATPIVFNGAAGASTVSLTAPGSNSYYACIYWDLYTSSAGVIYGATASSPTPIYPDQYWRIPLAFVLLTTGQSTVVASNIYDARTWIQANKPLVLASGSLSANTSISCSGAAALSQTFSFGTAAITVTYSNLTIGVPVNINVQNFGAVTLTLKFAATTPSGGTYTVNGKQAGTSATTYTNLGTTGWSFLAGAIWSFTGVTQPAGIINFVVG